MIDRYRVIRYNGDKGPFCRDCGSSFRIKFSFLWFHIKEKRCLNLACRNGTKIKSEYYH